MSSWTDGYVSDIQYTSGFYRELSPGFLSTVLNLQGYRAPDPAAPFTYCELGCGQGYGTGILAAAYPHGSFWGIDFNPAQIANARRLASKGGLTNIEFIEDSFEELSKGSQPQMPKFDYIGLHGIYSWISPENRGFIIDFIARNLKPGGVVYNSYNCLPGWAPVGPLQRLLREHAKLNPGRSDQQMETGMLFVNKLREAGAGYFTVNASLSSRLDLMKTANRNYLAHEYLNESWYPLFHADVAQELDRAKLSFAASASILENVEMFSVPEPVRKILADVTSPIMYQTIKDYTINQTFRKDIYVRGANKMGRLEHEAVLRELALTSTARKAELSLEFKTPLGKAKGAPDVYEPIIEVLEQRHSATLGELQSHPKLAAQGLGTLVQAYQLMLGNMQVHPAFPGTHKDSAVAFNMAVADEIIMGADYAVGAAAYAGTGIGMSFIEACAFVSLAKNDKISSEELVAEVWQNMRRAGRRLIKDGQTVQADDENIAGLRPVVQQLLETGVPAWRKLGFI